MWHRKEYIEGLIAKSLYEPLTARERRRLDKAIASDPALAELAGQMKAMVDRLPQDVELSTPDLLPDLRIAIAGEAPEAAWEAPLRGRSKWVAVAMVIGVCLPGLFALNMLNTMDGSPDGAGVAQAPAASLMQQAIRQSEALISEHKPAEALKLLETALVAQSTDPDVAQARLMLADLSFEENMYRPALTAYTAVQSNHPDYILALDEDTRVRIAERVELLDECSANGFETLMAYNAALRAADDQFERLESVAARAAADPHGLLAGRVLWSMAELVSDSEPLTTADARVAALARVRDRCSNPVVEARANFEAGHTYEREVGDTERAAEAYRLAGRHSAYEAAAATALARLEPR